MTTMDELIRAKVGRGTVGERSWPPAGAVAIPAEATRPTPGYAGAGTGAAPPEAPLDMDSAIRIAILRQRTGYTGPIVLPIGDRQNDGR